MTLVLNDGHLSGPFNGYRFDSDFWEQDISDDLNNYPDECDNPYQNASGMAFDSSSVFIGQGIKNEFTNFHAIPKSSEKSILSDLDKINISDDVRIEAERIFQQLETNTKRGKRRKKLLFYCIFNAYLSLKQSKDPKYVAELVGIAPTEMSKAFSMCSESQTNYRPPSVFHSPIDFIPEYHRKVGLDESCLDSVLDLAKTILKKDPDLNENYPQVVAAGILLYYMTINGVSVNKKEFSKLVRRSEMTISKMYKRISYIHNS